MAGDLIIRDGREADFERLKAIEVDAFETLLQAGGVFGEASSSTDEELMHFVKAGLLLVAANADDLPVGYVGASFEGDCLHVAEIDVARGWQRRGIGRALMRAVLAEGEKHGLRAATLTTDRLVAFNAPFYSSLGFRLLAHDELPDRLRAILAKEHAAGFDPARRVAMMLRLPGSST